MDKTEAVEAITALYESLPDGVSAVVYYFDPGDAYAYVMGSWSVVSQLAYLLGEHFEDFGPSLAMRHFRQQHGPGLATAAAYASEWCDEDAELVELVDAFAAGSIDMADLVKADRIFEQAYDLCESAGLDY